MGMTVIEKIFARKAGLDTVSPGETVVVDVDKPSASEQATAWRRALKPSIARFRRFKL